MSYASLSNAIFLSIFLGCLLPDALLLLLNAKSVRFDSLMQRQNKQNFI